MIQRTPLSRRGRTLAITPLDFLRIVMVALREGEAADVAQVDVETSQVTEVGVVAALRSPLQD